MNKTEFVDVLAKKTKLSKQKCDMFLEQLKNSILEVCSKGEEVNLRNFGKFSLQEKKERRYLNPQTKRYYISKAKKFINFKSYKNFKYAIQ